jgi:hypothetical protein
MVVLFFLGSGCATTERIELDTKGTDRLVLVKEMTTDAYGRPVPGKYLKQRPAKKGKHYTAVLMRDGLPVRSVDIGIIGSGRPDFAKPFVVLGTSIAAGGVGGFRVGLWSFSDVGGPVGNEPMSDREARGRASFAVISTMVGTAVGLVVGFVKSVPVMAEQIKLLVLESDETLLGYSEYEYDSSRRLSLVRRHSAGGSRDYIVSTKYSYEDSSDVPVSSETSSDYVR